MTGDFYKTLLIQFFVLHPFPQRHYPLLEVSLSRFSEYLILSSPYVVNLVELVETDTCAMCVVVVAKLSLMFVRIGDNGFLPN